MARFEMLDPETGSGAAGGRLSGEVLLEMGMRCASGREGSVDLVAAHMYFNLADRQGTERAAFYRQELSEQMSKIEIAKALRAAREWMTTH